MANAQIRILIIQANPPGTTALGSSDEIRNVQQALRQSGAHGLFSVTIAPAAQINDILPTLHDQQPHILHFTGHGDGRGGLILNAPDDPDGLVLSAGNLAKLIQLHQAEATTKLQLVLLVGCDTAPAAQQLLDHVACAIGMSAAISDGAALQLAPPFYGALGRGYSIGNALEAALVALDSQPMYTADAAMVQRYAAPGVDTTTLRALDWLAPTHATSKRHPDHLSYLRAWFLPHGLRAVPLSLLHSDRQEPADLLDLYVPLPVDFALTVRTEEGKIVDWSGGRLADRPTDEAVAEVGNFPEPRDAHATAMGSRRQWAELGVDAAGLAPVVAAVERRFDDTRRNERSIYDGEHRQPPLAAHHAAALQTRFVLLGDPGSGKSSFLRHLTLCLAGALRHRWDDPGVPNQATLEGLYEGWPQQPLAGYTPLYLELRDVVRSAFPEATAPLAQISEKILWHYLAGHAELAAYCGLLHELIEQGTLILLLDGLDEIPDADKPARRNQMIAFVNALRTQYPALRMVISSRPYAYLEAEWQLTEFGHTTLAPLQQNQLDELATALFSVAHCSDPAAEARSFVGELTRHPDMDPKLHANPLLFTLLGAIWLSGNESEADQRLPTKQAGLYRRAVTLLLEDWTKPRVSEKSLTELLRLTVDELRAVLEILACTVHQQQQRDQDTTLFESKELFIILDSDDDLPADLTRPILTYLEKRAGLLISPTRNSFYFSHRSFQEYLAACELTCADPLKRHPPVKTDRRFPDGLIERVRAAPHLWHNVALLAADELMAGGRERDLWPLLADLVQPYREQQTYPAAAVLALRMAHREDLFQLHKKHPHYRQYGTLFNELSEVAHRVLTDDTNFTPADRNIAGELLGRRPEHDTRPGVGCVNGLPAIDWIKIPETDEQGRREFIYQKTERRTEPTFWMARYPVTYGQFQTFIEAADGFTNPLWWKGLAAPAEDKAKPGNQAFEFYNHPRERVSWYDAIAFCRWLTAKAQANPSLLPPELQGQINWRITLPTEWQWEKAARGFDGRHYPWGEEYVSGDANIDETWRKEGPHYLQKTSAVGIYPRNHSPFGIVDMSGNVWEWCLNEYDNPEKIQERGDATRVVRGGSWTSNSNLASALARDDFLNLRNFNGFRVVVVGFSVPVL